jgi:CheY-specific phosphatase CheX
MEAELISSISEGIKQILSEIGFSDIRKIDKNSESIEVVTTIGITGDLRGTLILKANKQSAIAIANKMLKAIHPYNVSDDFGIPQKEAIYEVTNLFAGRSLNILSEKNIDCSLTPPTIITGQKIFPVVYDMQFSTNLFFTGDFGDISLYIGVIKK